MGRPQSRPMDDALQRHGLRSLAQPYQRPAPFRACAARIAASQAAPVQAGRERVRSHPVHLLQEARPPAADGDCFSLRACHGQWRNLCRRQHGRRACEHHRRLHGLVQRGRARRLTAGYGHTRPAASRSEERGCTAISAGARAQERGRLLLVDVSLPGGWRTAAAECPSGANDAAGYGSRAARLPGGHPRRGGRARGGSGGGGGGAGVEAAGARVRDPRAQCGLRGDGHGGRHNPGASSRAPNEAAEAGRRGFQRLGPPEAETVDAWWSESGGE